MQRSATKRLDHFLGLNNVADPMRGTDVGQKTEETWAWLSVADNININDNKGIRLREGYQPFVSGTSITGSYATLDRTRMYIIDGVNLKRVHADGTVLTLAYHDGTALTLTAGAEAHWAEINGTVYLSCGTGKFQIEQDNTVWVWGVPVPIAGGGTPPDTPSIMFCITYVDAAGRESGASAVGYDIPTVALDTPVTINTGRLPMLPGYGMNVYTSTAGDVENAIQAQAIPAPTAINRQDGYLAVEPPIDSPASPAPATPSAATYKPTLLSGGTVLYLAASIPAGGIGAYSGACGDGEELTTQFMDAPPAAGAHVAFAGGMAYLAEYMPSADQTVIWASAPLAYHLFNLDEGYFIVPGKVTLLYGAGDTLLVATDQRIYLYDGEKLEQVARYGAVPGQHADLGEDGKIYFWTTRGLCRISPFENMTEHNVSVAPGVLAGGGIIESDGYKRYVVIIQSGGNAYNPRS